ncbi:flagellar assembly protein FliH [Phycicoccus sp. MAQZ13P-2]|uniref:FliH/SctL family protein n=1 Tax=Phycicoccus mangrovi TaxID=2840470 RepID=UPI001C007DC7|nr:FliH/SctL family protein [Phycicoccus mangrovi]MBT9254941.1 flagellar assembly protein FliH [Phycicoccus mangrovi]MBT9256062.1 flagellar assembly protein FliH [Phycicoccus mangrovi]MBT9273925.1 flagellar assembly protein FliH [Phycicoccus mangrovi]
MTSSTDLRPTTLLRGADELRPASFGRQLAPAGDPAGVGIPAEWLEGREAGIAAGRREAAAEQVAWLERAEAAAAAERAEHARRVTAALTGIGRAAEDAVAGLTVRDVLTTAAALAVDIAEALVGHHLEVDGCAARDAVARALTEVPRGGTVLVRLNPDDAELLAASAEDLGALAPTSVLEVVADPTVERGGCLADVGDRTVDAQLSSALTRVREVLAR